MQQCPPELIALGHELADAVHPIITQYFRRDNGIEIKDDATPVTLADRAIEQLWRDIIMEKRPDDGIWGEEFGRYKTDAEYQWIFDPIDGTKAFTLGRPSFGCLIGLYHVTQGFILGLCYQPITKDRWVGALGYPTTYNGDVLPQRQNPPAGAPLRAAFTNPMRFQDGLTRCHDALIEQRAVIAYGGDCLNFASIASGLVDISAENKQSIYDIACFVPILQGVGACISELDGTPIGLDMKQVMIAAATPELHQRFLRIAAGQ
jgi:inositol-phosphate phosphatase/L-galactose 1-phosphate phosphatase/histidinol-phosphatase